MICPTDSIPCALETGGTACCGAVARECPTCPPWIIRCAHFEDEWLTLASREEYRKVYPEVVTPIKHAYGVTCWHRGATRPSRSHPGAIEGPERPRLYTDDYEEALAYFHEAEEALLRGVL